MRIQDYCLSLVIVDFFKIIFTDLIQGFFSEVLKIQEFIFGFTDQLIDNVPAYSTSGRRAWKGPYLESDQADPWGSQYYANVIYLQSIYINATYPSIVLSAGPNKLIETQYSQTGPGITIGGDDIVFRLK